MILTLLIYVFIAAVIIGLLVVVFYAIVGLFAGSSLGIATAATSIKNRNFYNDCVSRGITEPSNANREKIDLVGQLHNISDPFRVFSEIYNNETSITAKQKKKMEPETKATMIGFFSCVLGTLFFLLFILPHTPYSLDIYGGAKGVVMVMLPFSMGLIGGGIGCAIAKLKKTQAERNAKKEEVEKKLNKLEW